MPGEVVHEHTVTIVTSIGLTGLTESDAIRIFFLKINVNLWHLVRFK